MVVLTQQEREVIDRFKQLPAKRRRYVMLAMVEGVDIEREFESLADRWERETRLFASPSRIASHPLARQIIEMGPEAIPLILRRMKKRPWFWFRALKELSGLKTGPVTPDMRGDMQKMSQAWIKWGENRGLI